MSKLLGTPFGLSINTPDVDHFLYFKISRIRLLEYYATFLVGRVVICNHVLQSTLWFFLITVCIHMVHLAQGGCGQ